MKRFENEEELKSFLKNHAPIPPEAQRGQLNQIMNRLNLSESSRNAPRLSWIFGGALAASIVGVTAFWLGAQTQLKLSQGSYAGSQPELVWELLVDPETGGESVELEVGEEYLQLVL